MEEDPLSTSQASPAAATAADAAASTALASMLRTSCTIIDMGSYLLSELCSRPYTADDAALPCIAGEHVRQILPEALVERAALFPPFDPARQVPLQAVACLQFCFCCLSAPHASPVCSRYQVQAYSCRSNACRGFAEWLAVLYQCFCSITIKPLHASLHNHCRHTSHGHTCEDGLHQDMRPTHVCVTTFYDFELSPQSGSA
jgi:hypothetical protein